MSSSIITTLTATDADQGSNAMLSYGILRGDVFGNLTVTRALSTLTVTFKLWNDKSWKCTYSDLVCIVSSTSCALIQCPLPPVLTLLF